jgi:multimeric flavodoxin WrbA
MVDTPVAPVKIAVVYHSGYGHTVRIAEAVARGAAAIRGASVKLVTAEEAPSRWGTLDSADAIIMGAPTYMGSLSAPFKAFMDALRTSNMLRSAGRERSRRVSPTALRAAATSRIR